MKPKITNQTLLYIFDEHEGNAKKIAKALGLNRNAVSSALFRLKGENLIESSGYGRYRLTDKGREKVGEILGNRPQESEVEPGKIIYADKVLPQPETEKTEIDWAREYIILANKLADALSHNKKTE